MKKALFVLAAVAMAAPAFAQGTIVFANRNIPTATGTGGGNGNGTYNVPIWEFDSAPGIQIGNGAGDLAGGVTVGLFKADGTLLGSSLLRTDANSQFFATGSQTLAVTGVDPGATASLVVRAWQGSATGLGTLDEARLAGRQYMDETTDARNAFTSRPLGGTPPAGGLPITPPGMTGWGPEDNTGLELTVVPEPSTIALGALGIGALLLRRRK